MNKCTLWRKCICWIIFWTPKYTIMEEDGGQIRQHNSHTSDPRWRGNVGTKTSIHPLQTNLVHSIRSLSFVASRSHSTSLFVHTFLSVVSSFNMFQLTHSPFHFFIHPYISLSRLKFQHVPVNPLPIPLLYSYIGLPFSQSSQVSICSS